MTDDKPTNPQSESPLIVTNVPMSKGFASIFFTRTFLNIFILMLSSHSLGIAIAYPSPAMPSLCDFLDFSRLEISLFSAVTSLTAILGPLLTNPLLKHRGRRFTVQCISFIFSLSWLLLLASGPGRRILAHLHRAVLGIAAGGISAVVPMYISELSPPDLRSIYGSMHQFGVSVGIFTTNLLGMWFDWRRLAFFSFALSLAAPLALSAVPDSPALRPAAGARQDKEGLCGATYLRSFTIGLMMMFFQQVSGVNAVLTNLASIVTSRSGPALAASAQCVAVVACVSVIDRIGRTAAWAVSLFGSAASMAGLAAAVRFAWPAGVAAAAAFGFLFFFCFGLGPIPWFLPPELFPDRIRPRATAVLSSANWILSFAVVLAYPAAADLFGAFAVLMFFAVVLVAGGAFGVVALGGKGDQPAMESLLHQAERMVPKYLSPDRIL
jgi:MFS family permease